MFKFKNYKFGFDLWGLLIFLIIMMPNFIWFAIPAPNDILRNPSIMSLGDMIGQVAQIIMVASLCALINIQRQKTIPKGLFTGIVILVLLYFIGWCFYYTGVTSPVIILDLCISPCLAFSLLAISRQNLPALVAAVIFMICHVQSSIVNFIL